MRDDKQGAKRDIQLELKALRLNGWPRLGLS